MRYLILMIEMLSFLALQNLWGCPSVFSFDRLSKSVESFVMIYRWNFSRETLLGIPEAEPLVLSWCIFISFIFHRSSSLKISNTCWSTTLIISNSCCSTSLIISNSCSSTSLIIIIVGIIIAFLGQNLPVELYYISISTSYDTATQHVLMIIDQSSSSSYYSIDLFICLFSFVCYYTAVAAFNKTK